MWLRLCAVVVLSCGIAACSAEPPGVLGGADAGALSEVAVPKPAPVTSIEKLRCRTVLGEVEGFGRDSVRSTAEQNRSDAIVAEKAHRAEMGQSVAHVELEATECVAVYPIGALEWYCMARAKVCALPQSPS